MQISMRNDIYLFGFKGRNDAGHVWASKPVDLVAVMTAIKLSDILVGQSISCLLNDSEMWQSKCVLALYMRL